MMFAKQGRDNVAGMLAIGPDHLTRVIGWLPRFTVHGRETPSGRAALHPTRHRPVG